MLSVFRGKVPPDATDCRYEPLTAQPIEQTILDPNVDMDELGFLAVAASMLGRGTAESLWELKAGDPAAPEDGAFTIERESATSPPESVRSRVFLVRDSGALAQLEGHRHIDMSDASVLVIHAKAIPPRQARTLALDLGGPESNQREKSRLSR